MQQINMIGDTCKDRRIDYDLIDKINQQYEPGGRKEELKAKLDKKKGLEKEKEIKEKLNPATDIKYIKTPDELRDIKGHYTLQKGVYVIDFEINVSNGCCLILEPGVEFYFTKDAGITCEGLFETRGKSGLEVLLTAKDKKKGWKNLYLKGEAEAIVDYAKFSYGRGRQDNTEFIAGGAILLESKRELIPTITIYNSCFENNFSKNLMDNDGDGFFPFTKLGTFNGKVLNVNLNFQMNINKNININPFFDFKYSMLNGIEEINDYNAICFDNDPYLVVLWNRGDEYNNTNANLRTGVRISAHVSKDISFVSKIN